MEVKYNEWNKKLLKEMRFLKKKPVLYLNVCCAPCLTVQLEKYTKHFHKIYVIFQNDCICDREEFDRRLNCFKDYIKKYKNIKIIDESYDHETWLQGVAKGRENIPEGGARCIQCYRYRLEYSVLKALDHYKKKNRNRKAYFSTTLTTSTYKKPVALNVFMYEFTRNTELTPLYSDFTDEFQRSEDVSIKEGMYRQNFCGCEFAKNNN